MIGTTISVEGPPHGGGGIRKIPDIKIGIIETGGDENIGGIRQMRSIRVT